MAAASDASFRLFLGLWPPAAVCAALQAHAACWHWPPTARRSAPEKLHITLHFLGNVAPGQLPALQQALSGVTWEGCRLRLDQPQVWPGGIAVLEANAVPAPLERLHARLGEVLQAVGMEVEQRRYRPHVTFARKAQGARPPAQAAPVEWPAQARFVLARSLPGGRGYLQLQAFG